METLSWRGSGELVGVDRVGAWRSYRCWDRGRGRFEEGDWKGESLNGDGCIDEPRSWNFLLHGLVGLRL